MAKPLRPISKEARDHLHSKLDRMKGLEREKTIKRLEQYDRGNNTRHRDWKPERE